MTMNVDVAMLEEIVVLRAELYQALALVREAVPTFINLRGVNETVWNDSPTTAACDAWLARARALGLSDTRDGVDTPSESNMWRGITNWVRAEE